MLPNIIKLSFRAIRNTELLRTTDLRSTMKCNYARWVSRRPSAILNEHELYDSEDTTTMKEVHKKAAKRAREERLEIKKKAKREAKEKEKNEETVTKEPLYKALKEDDRLIRCTIFQITHISRVSLLISNNSRMISMLYIFCFQFSNDRY